MSTFTPNKSIEQPAAGSYNDDWNVPVNADWAIIDAAFGGNTSINVTGVTAGTYTLTLTQYQPPNIVFTGTLSANLVYEVPNGVGGVWTVYNNTTGAFTLTFGTPSASLALPAANRTFVVSDGTNMQLADSAYQAIQIANAFATNAANTAAAAAQAAAEAYASNASNITSGTVGNAYLPNAGLGPGVTIAADPGTTPTGSPGDIFYYY